MKKRSDMVSQAEVDAFERVRAQITSLSEEISLLAKKSPDGPLNRFKVSIVNERLRLANTLLSGSHKPFEDFAQFNETDLPSASDAVVVLSQYLSALEGWRSANVVTDGISWYWNTEEREYRASAPTRGRRTGD